MTSTTAPTYRGINALTGEKSPLLSMLAAADEISGQASEIDRLRQENAGLRCRIDELTDGGSLEHELAERGRELLALRAENARLRRERGA